MQTAAGHSASNLIDDGPMTPAAPVASGELAEGLMLMRASAINVVRLQLAMERRDRRVALQAVDDLVEIDRQLEDFLSEIPADPHLSPLQRALEDGRSALAREKLTLAAGAMGPTVAPPVESWVEPPAPSGAAALPAPVDSFDAVIEAEFEPESRNRVVPFLVIAAALMVAVAAAVWWFAPELLPLDRVQAELASWMGG
jgi:hypothetical protein